MHRLKRILLYASFTAAVLLVSLPEAGVAQVNMQQMPNYSTTRNRADVPAAVSNPDLRMVPEDFVKLKLAPGFLLSLNVLEDSDFAGTFRIDDLGDIIVPILGTVHVAGETAADARAQIKKRLLDEHFLNDPQVTLTVIEYTAPEVTIIGEVTSPGKYPLLVPHKLVEVLALAGGPALLAGNEVQIISNSKPAEPVLVHYSKGSDPQTIENVLVYPGDTVQVKRAGIVYVLGAVTRPGGYVMQEEGKLDVRQAISLANGTTIAASTGTIYLLRRNADGTEVDIALPFNKMLHGQRTDVQLQPTDVLYVPTSKIKAILTNSQTILSSAASASIYAAMY